MSLINEALKKAQRQRTAESTEAPPMPGGGAAAGRARPRSAQSLLLLVAGGVVLVVLSVVATVFLIARRPGPSTVTAKPKPAPMAEAPVVAMPLAEKGPPASVVASAPVEKTPAPAKPAEMTTPTGTKPTPASGPKAAPPPSSFAETKAAAETKPAAASPPATLPTAPADIAPVATAPATPAPPPLPPTAVKADERVHAFIDAIRVSGIRSSGGESRVLMNDRVYRVNDIVERNLGLRLTKVDPDSLTFTDPNGVTYVKYF
jgi:hypothetical protein